MTIAAWPSELPCGLVDFTLQGGARSAGANSLLPAAIGASFGGPHWIASVSQLPLRTPAQIAAARALEGRLDGGASPILINVCVGSFSPALSSSPAMACALTADALAGATTLHIAFTGSRVALRGGEYLNVDDDDVDKRLHMVTEITGGTDAAPIVKITPPLRVALSNGDPVYFDNLVCPMRLVDGLDLPITLGRFSGIEMSLEEWFDPPVILALRNLTLSPHTIESGSAEDTFVGYLIGTSAGSTVTLTGTAGSRFKLVDNGGGVWSITAGSVATDYGASHNHSLTVHEVLAGYINTPRDSTLTVNVTLPLPSSMVLTFDNPGFETGDMTGWTLSHSSIHAQVFAGDDFPHSGTYLAFGGTQPATRFWQDFDVTDFAARIDTGHVALEDFRAWHSTYDTQSDNGQLEARFLDSIGSQIGFVHTPSHNPGAWNLLTMDPVTVPVGTRTLRLGVVSFRIEGVNNDNQWDDFQSCQLVYNP